MKRNKTSISHDGAIVQELRDEGPGRLVPVTRRICDNTPREAVPAPFLKAPCRRTLFSGRIDDFRHLEDRQEHGDDDTANDYTQEDDQ